MSEEQAEMCVNCDRPTGRAGRGDDSLYCEECDEGPFCAECWAEHHNGNTLAARLHDVEAERDKALRRLMGLFEEHCTARRIKGADFHTWNVSEAHAARVLAHYGWIQIIGGDGRLLYANRAEKRE